MTGLNDAMVSALSAISSFRGESLAYRTSSSGGSFTALTGFVLDREDRQPFGYDEQHRAEYSEQTATLSGPLTPALAVGYQLQDGNSAVWAIETAELDGQQICRLRRITSKNGGPDRGGAS